MTQEEINIIIEKHQKWLNGEPGGERANLYEEDIHGLILNGADLRKGTFYRTNLRECDLRAANFNEADLRWADLSLANMKQTYFEKANLTGANLQSGDMREAHMEGVNINIANLFGAKFSKAYDLPYIPISCPEYGEFTAWKRASGKIVKLLIPEDALRCSATTRKCRSSKAKVLGIYNTEMELLEDTQVASDWSSKFVYIVGETVSTEATFDTDRWNECSEGIHFFTGFQEAVDYNY